MTADIRGCSDARCLRAHYGRGLCRLHYDRARRAGTIGQHATAPRLPDHCAVTGCGRPRVRNKRRPDGTYNHYALCSAHRSRRYRHGDELRGGDIRDHREGPWMNGNGYMEMAAPGHPVAMMNGHAKQHRVVLFDIIGPGSHPCHWCGILVDWGKRHPESGALTVDHLDNVRTNNDPSNLAVSCHPCNAQRRAA